MEKFIDRILSKHVEDVVQCLAEDGLVQDIRAEQQSNGEWVVYFVPIKTLDWANLDKGFQTNILSS